MDLEQLKSLWVGDLVYVKSLDANAKWSKLIDSKWAYVIYKGDQIKLEISDLAPERKSTEMNPELKKLEETLKNKNYSKPKKENARLKSSIDLHIEKLNPQLSNAIPQAIINHQITRCKMYLDEAIAQYMLSVKIIHGKGNGTLRLEVEQILKSIPEVKSIYPIHENGAVEVWFQY